MNFFPDGSRWRVAPGLVIGAAVAGLGCGSIIGSLANRVDEEPPPVVPSANSLALHADWLVADLHADPLLLDRDLLVRSLTQHVDIPRLIEGNIALEGFGVVTQVPRDITNRQFNLAIDGEGDDGLRDLTETQNWPEETRESLLARATYQASKLHTFESQSGGTFRIIRSQADLNTYLAARQTDSAITAGFLALEGAHALEGELANVQTLFDAGFRMFGLVHFHNSDVGGSAHGDVPLGLTPFGRDVVERASQLRMIIDLAHGSAPLIDEVLDLIASMPAPQRPGIVVSHTGVRGTVDNDRNLSDAQIQRVAAAGGVIGIGFFELAIGGRAVSDIVAAIRHAVNLVGADHVALGSDWDGFVTVPMDASDVAKVTHALLESGLPPSDVERIMGLNVIELFQTSLPPQ